MKTFFYLSFVTLLANVRATPKYGGHESLNQHISTAEIAITPTETLSTSNYIPSNAPSSSLAPIIPTPSAPPSSNSTTTPSPSTGITLPPTCHRHNNIPVGWLPAGTNITALQALVAPNTTPCTYGDFAHITSPTSYDDTTTSHSASAAAQAGAVFTLALQPYIPFNEIDVSKIVASMQVALEAGNSVVWLRFAHEMNWYISSNAGNKDTPYVGSTEEFKTLWRGIATAVDRSRVKMFWSPNTPVPPDTVESIGRDWFPGADYVDIVGLDVYPQSTDITFSTAFGSFCDTYSTRYNLPFVLGETGYFAGGTDAEKTYWLQQVSSVEAKQRCPLYEGFSWFEYDKPSEGDFRVVEGSTNLAAGVLG